MRKANLRLNSQILFPSPSPDPRGTMPTMTSSDRATDRVDSAEPGFRYTRKVFFYETDLAGVVHFSCYFRYMEEAEHALWRAAGLTVNRAGADIGYPRVSATFDYKSPLFFEDELTIVARVHAVTKGTIKDSFVCMRGETSDRYRLADDSLRDEA